MSIISVAAVTGLLALLLKRADKHILPIALLAICSILDEIIGYYLKVKYKNNLTAYYITGCFEYSLFAWFVIVNIDSGLIKKAIRVSIVTYFIAMLGYLYFFLQSDSYSKVIVKDYFTMASGLLLTAWSIAYFRDIFNRISKFEFLNVYVLLIVSGILFYFAFSTIFYAAENYLVSQSIKENPNLFTDILKAKFTAFSYAYNQLKDISVFLYLTNILLYICIFIGLTKSAFTKRNAGDNIRVSTDPRATLQL